MLGSVLIGRRLLSPNSQFGGKTEIWAKIDLSSEFHKSELQTQIDFWAVCGHGLRV